MRYNLDITDTSGTGATPLGLSQWVSVREGSAKSVANASRKTQFGDGYGQFAKNGINSDRDSWTLVFIPLQDGVPSGTAYWTAMQTFYNAVVDRDWFWYTALGDTSPKKWRIDSNSYKPTPISQTHWSVTFTITQQFDGGV